MDVPKNLSRAYIGESVAISKYVIFSQITRDKRFVFVSKVFLDVAENEKGHAEIFAKFLKRMKVKPVEVDFKAPIRFGNTAQNLRFAVKDESLEAKKIYPKLAEVAEEKGFEDVANKLRTLAKIERWHGKKFESLLKEVGIGRMFRMDAKVDWICLVCEYDHHGNAPLKVYPNCGAKFYNFVAKDLMGVVL